MNLPELIANGDLFDSKAETYKAFYEEISHQLQRMDYIEKDC